MTARIVSLVSMKGGVGKSNTIASFASELDRMKKKSLIIDLDGNQVTTENLGHKGHDYTSVGLLNGDKITPVKCTDYIDLVPSEIRNYIMTNIGDKCLLNAIVRNEYRDNYDYIFIDPPGQWSALTRNALRCSDICILPGNPASMDYEPIQLLIDQMCEIDLPQEPDVWVILNQWHEKYNQNGIIEEYRQFDDMFYGKPITMMKSFRNLTSNFYGYKLRGSARKQINDLMIGVGVL